MSGSLQANPFIPQGTLNRLLGSMSFPDNPGLNITAAFLGSEAFSVRPGGPVTTMIPTLTGAVNSPEPFMLLEVTAHLIRSQLFSDAWRQQWLSNSQIGHGILRLDVAPGSGMGSFDLVNCNITSVAPFNITGRDAGIMVALTGIYYLNNVLWQ